MLFSATKRRHYFCHIYIYIYIDQEAEDSLTEIEKSILKRYFDFQNCTLMPTAHNAERNFNIDYVENSQTKKIAFYSYNRFKCCLRNNKNVNYGSMAHVTVFDKEICMNLGTQTSTCDQYKRPISREMPSRHPIMHWHLQLHLHLWNSNPVRLWHPQVHLHLWNCHPVMLRHPC